MASSTVSRSWRYDVFPSFSGEDVRKSFLSHLLEKLQRKLVTTFIDHGIERSRPIGPELIYAIRESRIAIVVFSKKYASSTWCLNELVEIHKCYEELDQMVFPVFYDVDPSHVRKQIGDFGKAFDESCKGKPDDLRQRWIKALKEVANMAGEDSQNWSSEASMIERIANDVSNKLIIPSNDSGDFVGIEAHLEELNSVLSLESGGVRTVGIVGPSGIGKTTIVRALFSRICSQFDHHAFLSYKRTNKDNFGMKLGWEETFLSEILCEKNIKVCHLGVVEQKLKHKKVLIIVDDVDELELLTTLVGQTRWVGSGSRIIVITQDRKLLKSHDIGLTYEVEFPSIDLALEMFCRSAFRQNSPPDGFREVAVEVVKLSGYLPLGLNVFGSSFRGMEKEEWMEMLPRLQDGLDGKIEKTLRVSYDMLDRKDQDLFLHIACLFNGRNVDYIKSMLGDEVYIRLRMLAYKSLIRITPSINTVQMHSLLQKLGKEIVRAESINDPGKRRFLVDADDICDVFTSNSGTENVKGILFNASEVKEPLFIDENSFKGMRNLQFLKIYKEWSKETCGGGLHLPQDLVHFPRKVKLLHWNEYPLKFMPFNFRAEYLVKLKMMDSKLEKLWEGTQLLPNLKKMDMRWSAYLKEIPDLSKAINLEKLNLRGCTSLVTLPSTIRNLKKLRMLILKGCSELKVLPADVGLVSLESLDLRGCFQLKTFPRISRNISELFLDETKIVGEEDCSWLEKISHLVKLDWDGLPLRCMPANFRPDYLIELRVRGSKLEKLWPGVQRLGNLRAMDLSGCESLKQIPDLSMATGIYDLKLNNCKSLVMLPSSVRHLRYLKDLSMKGCTMLEVLPTGTKLENLCKLDLSGCSRLKCFPQISTRIKDLYLMDTAIKEIPYWIENMASLANLKMNRCKKLKKISANILKLELLQADFSDCEGMTMFVGSVMDDQLPGPNEASFPLTEVFRDSNLKLSNCFNLNGDAREMIARSYVHSAILPGGEVPMYFPHRARGSSLIIPLHESSFSQEEFGIKACIVFGPPVHPQDYSADIGVRWCFRGKKGVHPFDIDVASCMTDHLVMLFFRMSDEEDESPLELNDNVVQFEFYYHSHACSCGNFGLDHRRQNCPHLPQRIKGCGVRVFNVSPSRSLVTSFRSLKTENDLRLFKKLDYKKRMGCPNIITTWELPSFVNLKEFPDLSSFINLNCLSLNNCKNLVMVPSSISYLYNLKRLCMMECTKLQVLPTDINLPSLLILSLSGCSQLKCFPQISTIITDLCLDDTAIEEFPDLSSFINLYCLSLNSCKNLVMVPSYISYLNNLEELYMMECTKLEVLPTDINLPSLSILNLSGCSRLKCFPRISTIITNLYLDDTAIEEVPSWIENMASLVKLKMSQCKNLKIISANILKLRLLEADFSECEELMTMCDASVVDDQLLGPHEASFPLIVTTQASNLMLPLDFSNVVCGIISLKLCNCFNLDRDAREIIAQSYVYGAILPGGEVPMCFTHRTRGCSLTIPLHKSSFSQEEFGIKACIVVGPSLDCSAGIEIRWCFRGKNGVCYIGNEVDSCEMDHLVMVFFRISKQEVDESPLDLNYNVLQFDCCVLCDKDCEQHCTIKGCGIRVLDISPSQDSTARSFATEYNQHSGESDVQTDINCEAVDNYQSGESDVETGRSKKRMLMTDVTSQEPSSSPNLELTHPNLDLSLGLFGASARVSSRNRTDAPSLNLSLSAFDPCLGGESSHFDPMITEEEDTGTRTLNLPLSSFDPMVIEEEEEEDAGRRRGSEDPSSLSPQLVNYFR